MIIPIKLEVESYKFPVSNYIIILLTSFFFFFTLLESNSHLFESMVLTDFNPKGLIGNMFLHADIMHLLGNMLFLYVFGSAICVVFGNIVYPLVYILLGIIASSIHLVFQGGPAVGASGAISGLMGLTLIWFPKNKVKFLYFFGFIANGTFRLNVIIVILFYFLMDLLGIVSGGDNVAHFAHLGGLFGGMLIGFFLQAANVISINEITLIDVFTKKERRSLNINYNELIEESKELKLQETMQIIGQGTYREPIPLTKPEVHIPEINPDADPKFRILRSLKTENDLKCFIINEGDSICDVSVLSPDGIYCEIIPKEEFKSKATGVLRFENLTSPEKISIHMKFNNFQIKNFIFDPAQNKII
ncbi:MAG TPA: rhomboid family intramembrane serine protease [Ignavibacteriaceae bacterium]|nr:rhomboid family intramembrane serine protease [Ignavibacteriaceae bacterium]